MSNTYLYITGCANGMDLLLYLLNLVYSKCQLAVEPIQDIGVAEIPMESSHGFKIHQNRSIFGFSNQPQSDFNTEIATKVLVVLSKNRPTPYFLHAFKKNILESRALSSDEFTTVKLLVIKNIKDRILEKFRSSALILKLILINA